MRRRISFAIFLLILTATAPPALAGGEPEKGKTYARKACEICHSIEPNVKSSPNMKAPAFSEIANSHLVTERQIETWLQSSHPGMSGFIVPRESRDDLVAYITSLRTIAPEAR